MDEENDKEKMTMLRKCFVMFDSNKDGKIEKEKIRTILHTLGANFVQEELEVFLNELDSEVVGMLNFDCFVKVVGHFLEDKDEEEMQNELKETFRLYDKEEKGFIPTSCLREILAALDENLTSEELDSIIEEIDEDASGTVDFEEFMQMMTGD